jgi:hypothetical protein
MENAIPGIVNSLIGDSPWIALCVYFFMQNQKLHAEQKNILQSQMELFQKVALKVGNDA